jgi:hypothetical protein
MSDVYVVSKEYWNDYELLAIFDNYDLAKKFVKNIAPDSRYEQPEINIYELNKYQQEVEQDLKHYIISEKNGEYRVAKSCDFSTPLDTKKERIYKVWAKDSNEALTKIKNGI